MTDKLYPTCKLLGFFQDRDSSNLYNFTEAKPAEEIDPGVFAFTMNVIEIMDDGTERPAELTGFAVEMPEGGELTGEVLSL